MKKMTNTSHIEGLVYEHKLELRESGPNSKKPGTKFIMGTLGYRMNAANDQHNQNIFTTSRRGIVGMGTYSGEAFDLLPGSEIDMTKPSLTQSYNAKRQECLDNGTIAKKDDGKFYLTKVLTFKTPSGASDFVLGGSTNGWTEWKDRDGKTLNDLFRSNQ